MLPKEHYFPATTISEAPAYSFPGTMPFDLRLAHVEKFDGVFEDNVRRDLHGVQVNLDATGEVQHITLTEPMRVNYLDPTAVTLTESSVQRTPTGWHVESNALASRDIGKKTPMGMQLDAAVALQKNLFATWEREATTKDFPTWKNDVKAQEIEKVKRHLLPQQAIVFIDDVSSLTEAA